MANLKYVRAAELKHCRVAMLGFLGWVVQQFVHLPGEIYQESNPLKALVSVPLLSQIQIFLFIGAIELATLDQTYTAEEPWKLNFDPLNFSKVRYIKEREELKWLDAGVFACSTFSRSVLPLTHSKHAFAHNSSSSSFFSTNRASPSSR